MNMKHLLCCMILLSITFTATSASSLPTGGRDEMLHSTGRSILQNIEDCPLNIETLNYTALTSQCEQPYKVQPCCDGFKDLVCPHADTLNDLRNDCATKLFTYIYTLNYPKGFFSNLCTDTNEGHPCPVPITKNDTSADWRRSSPSRELMILTATFLLPLLGVPGF